MGETTSSKLLSASWAKVHDWYASAGEPSEHLAGLGLWKQLEGKGPCVVITTGKTASGETAVFGAFWQGKVPAIAEQHSGPARDVEAKEGDFCFCYTKGCHRHYKSRSNIKYSKYKSADDLPLAQIAVAYDGGVGLAIGGSFMVVSYCGAFEGSFGDLDEVEPVVVAGVPSPGSQPIPEELTVEATEVWAWQSTASSDSQDASKASEADCEQTRLTSLSTECRHPWVSAASPFALYRSQPVYCVPAHLTLQTVCQIILKREGDLGLSSAVAGATNADLSTMTVAQLYEKFCENQDTAEEQDCILDLKYDRKKVLQGTKEIEGLPKAEHVPVEYLNAFQEQIAALYAP